ncbi:MAG TPA: CAP domain-containing protein [Pyrinomonadaceae bacterium]|jgi:hypothetical protein
MNRKILIFAFLWLAIFSLYQTSFAQKVCDGKQLFSEKTCAGDALDAREKELFRLINEYRAQNKLPPLVSSDALSLVANRHLLDLNINVKFLTHGWSNCPYDIKNQSTWNCVSGAPKMLGVRYDGNGYENLYRNLNTVATPPLALEAWKKSETHNALILNLSIFKNLKWDGIGIAISSNYAAIWVGAKESVSNTAQESKGLGITFESVIDGLTKIVPVEKQSSTDRSDKWSGTSADKTVTMEIFGRAEDIAEATVGLTIKLEKKSALSQRHRGVLNTFLNNVVPNWSQREIWCDAAMLNLIKDRKIIQSSAIGNRFVEMTLNADNTLSVRVKPNNKSTILRY